MLSKFETDLLNHLQQVSNALANLQVDVDLDHSVWNSWLKELEDNTNGFVLTLMQKEMEHERSRNSIGQS